MTSRDVYRRPPARKRRTETGISRRALFGLRLTGAAQRDIDWDSLTARVREGWDRDGHEPWLRALEPVAEVLVEQALGGAERQAPDGRGGGVGYFRKPRVLDVGAGDGNVALAAARRGAEVEACDLAPSMVERGRARTAAAGFDVEWRVADAASLPYPDGSFDVVLSSFGAAQAPFARQAAAELARVARPDGTVALTAWVPRGLPGRLDELVEPYLPLPDGVRVPSKWGLQAVARARLESELEDIRLLTRTVRLGFSAPDAFLDTLLHPLPLAPEALRPELERLLASCNNRPPAVEVDARYLLAIGRRS